MAAALAADTVAQRLRDAPTRAAALDSLERHAAPIPTAVAMCAAPALFELLTMDEPDIDRSAFDRAGLLLGRLEAEAWPADGGEALHGAAFGDGGFVKQWNADSIVNAALRKPASELTQADARSYACSLAYQPAAIVRGVTAFTSATGLSNKEFVGSWISLEPIVSQKRMPSDDVPRQMLTLSLELLRSNELPDLAIGGAWVCVRYCLTGRPSLGPTALELGICELAAAHLAAMGSPADWVSISRGKAGRSFPILVSVSDVMKCFGGQASRPDLAACVSSGVFDHCVAAVAAVAAAGADDLPRDTNHSALYAALSAMRSCCTEPGCETKIRSIADALGFWLMHDLDYAPEFGWTTRGCTAQICERRTASVLHCWTVAPRCCAS
jgi:hypothetical protein